MSRFLLATLGSLGDLHPYLALGRALRAAGHEATVATSADYREAVGAAGLGFAPLAPSLASLGERELATRRFFHPLLGPRRLFRAMVTDHLREAYADTLRAAEGAHFLVSHPLTVHVPVVASKLGLPWMPSVLAPYSLMSTQDPPVLPGAEWLGRLRGTLGPRAHAALFALARASVRRWEEPVHALRRELGHAPMRGSLLLDGERSPHGTLAMFDSVLAEPQSDWPPHTHVTGAATFDEAPPQLARTAHDVQAFLDAGEPPLVFALGSSAVWMAQDFWRHAIEAATALGKRAILAAGDAALPGLPRGIRAYAYLPYSQVFPRAAAVVHHAGVGTLSQALRSGVPQLITPAGFDQPDNAARAARLGLARVLPFRKVNARRLQDELAALLREPGYTRAAQAVATRLRPIDGARTAARQLVDTLRPAHAMLGTPAIRGAG